MSQVYEPPQQPYPPAAGLVGRSGDKRVGWAIGLSIAALAAALIALLAVFAGFAGSFFALDDSHGYEGEFDSPPTDGTAGDLGQASVGDCFIVEIDKPETIEAVDCAQRHDGEVYLVTDLDRSAGASYPGAADIYWRSDERCYTKWEEEFGYQYSEPSVYYAIFAPTEQTWEDGDRTIACAFTAEGMGSLVGTIGDDDSDDGDSDDENATAGSAR